MKIKDISLMCMVFLIIFIAINLIIYLLIPFINNHASRGSMLYGDETLSKIYPALTKEERNQLLRENWVYVKFEYEPYTQFKRQKQSGRYVNIDENGFRLVKNQCPYPISKDRYNIFIFGGSTAFGTGVADNETIASYIQAKMPDTCVYNFGRPSYFSTQERILFETLLMKEQIPNATMFIDGLNDFYYSIEEPQFTPQLRSFMSGNNKLLLAVSSLPLMQAISYDFSVHQAEPKLNNQSIARYNNNKNIIKSISSQYSIKTYFIIQPVPMYKYNLSYHLIVNKNPDKFKNWENTSIIYQALKLKDVIWLADIQEDMTANNYVDSVHYTPEFSERIATEIVKN